MMNFRNIKQFFLDDIKICRIFALIFVVLGIILRIKLFVYNPSLFKDEANLARNMIESPGYLELFKPLLRLQVAPPMFLILSKFVYGISEFIPLTPYRSDMLLRIVPLTCGIVTIPCFGYLVWKIFRNSYITAMGLGAIAFYPLLITFSANYKQYSMETLVTVLIMIIALNIRIDIDSLKVNITKFLMLALFPFFSLSSFYLLPFVYLNTLIDAIKKKQVIKYCCCIVSSLLVILIFYFVFLKNVIKAHYDAMIDFWLNTRMFGMYIMIRTASMCMIFVKRIKFAILFFGPVLFMYVLAKLNKYPCIDRLLLFIIPLVILAFLFPLRLIVKIKYRKYKFLFLMLLVCYLCIPFHKGNIENYRYRQETGRELWSIFADEYKTCSYVILSNSINTNLYYNYFYKYEYISAKKVLNEQKWQTLPSGVYCMLVTDKRRSIEKYNFLKSRSNIDVQILKRVNYKDSYYIKFKKIK